MGHLGSAIICRPVDLLDPLKVQKNANSYNVTFKHFRAIIVASEK
jgi:hypothetical protein